MPWPKQDYLVCSQTYGNYHFVAEAYEACKGDPNCAAVSVYYCDDSYNKVSALCLTTGLGFTLKRSSGSCIYPKIGIAIVLF